MLSVLLQTGSLTSNLSDHPQKVKGLIGITLGASVVSAQPFHSGIDLLILQHRGVHSDARDGLDCRAVS
jgi:hypothetical protein